MINKAYENTPLAVKRSLALTLATVALAGCGGKPGSHEVPAGESQKAKSAEVKSSISPVKIQKKPDSTPNSETKEIQGGLGGFPLKAEVSQEGSNFEFLIINVKGEAAGHFKVWISGLDKNNLPLDPVSVDAGDFQVKSIKLEPQTPKEVEATVVEVDVPGLGAGDTLTIEAEFQGASTVYEKILPQDPDGERLWSDKVYIASEATP